MSGHPGRSVARVALNDGNGAINMYLKWVYRVSACGRTSAMRRRALVSCRGRCTRPASWTRLGRAGVGCPEWMAAGEDGRGRAFLVIRETPGMTDLRTWLRRKTDPEARLRLARSLGAALARMHAAGITHPDLFAKHVLVAADGETVQFLDWRRAANGAV